MDALYAIWYHLFNLKKREKQPWKSFTFSKFAGFRACNFTKSNTPYGCFSRFVNCANSTKSRNTSHTIHQFKTNPANIFFSKLATETLLKGVKYVQS